MGHEGGFGVGIALRCHGVCLFIFLLLLFVWWRGLREFRDGSMVWMLVCFLLEVVLRTLTKLWLLNGRGAIGSCFFAGNSMTLFVPVSRFVSDAGMNWKRCSFDGWAVLALQPYSIGPTQKADKLETESQQIIRNVGLENRREYEKHNVIPA